jgi:hypothetical protein
MSDDLAPHSARFKAKLERARPEPTTMPGDGEPRDRDPLPTARVADDRPRGWLISVGFAVLAIVGCWQYGQLLSRIDRANAEAQRAYAHTAVLRVELEHLRATMPKPVAIDEVCRQRVTAMRGALLSLIRTGAVAMTDPGPEWMRWKIEEAR